MRRFKWLLLVVATCILLQEVPGMGALQQVEVSRNGLGTVAADDSTGFLELQGFTPTSRLIITSDYTQLGQLVNRTRYPITVALDADPNITVACNEGLLSCLNINWDLYMCLASDTSSAGTQTCGAANGAFSEVTWSGSGPVDGAAQRLGGLATDVGQSLYLLVRANPMALTPRVCAAATFSAIAASPEFSAVISDSAPVLPRAQKYTYRSCPEP